MQLARRLKTYGDCRRFLAWVVNEVLAARMDPGMGSKLSYIVNGIVKILETQDMEKIKSGLQDLQDQMEDQRYG